MEHIGRGGRGRGLVARLIIAAATGQSAEEFAAEEYRRMACTWCADRWAVAEDGAHHDIMGVQVPCDAAEQGDDDG